MWLAGPRVSGYDGMVPASLCSGVGMQPVSSAALPAVTCPTRKNSIGLICIHMFTLAVLCIRAAVGLPPKVVLRVRGCLQLTWLGELVRTFSSEPGTRGPGHHDAMTEAPGRKWPLQQRGERPRCQNRCLVCRPSHLCVCRVGTPPARKYK